MSIFEKSCRKCVNVTVLTIPQTESKVSTIQESIHRDLMIFCPFRKALVDLNGGEWTFSMPKHSFDPIR